MALIGHNCPSGRVIVTSDDCKNAASHLPMKYNSGQEHSSSRSHPAGCFFFDTEDEVLQIKWISFNSEINPSKTTPSSQFGGVCALSMTSFFKDFLNIVVI